MPEQIKLTKFIIIASVMVGIEPTPAANILTFGIVLLITEKVKVFYYPSINPYYSKWLPRSFKPVDINWCVKMFPSNQPRLVLVNHKSQWQVWVCQLHILFDGFTRTRSNFLGLLVLLSVIEPPMEALKVIKVVFALFRQPNMICKLDWMSESISDNISLLTNALIWMQ